MTQVFMLPNKSSTKTNSVDAVKFTLCRICWSLYKFFLNEIWEDQPNSVEEITLQVTIYLHTGGKMKSHFHPLGVQRSEQIVLRWQYLLVQLFGPFPWIASGMQNWEAKDEFSNYHRQWCNKPSRSVMWLNFISLSSEQILVNLPNSRVVLFKTPLESQLPNTFRIKRTH